MEYNYQDGSKVFFTSDHHFGHTNIIRFCNRPWPTISEHNRALIANWNAIVPEDGIVFHLGDFSYKGGGFPAMWWWVSCHVVDQRPASWSDNPCQR